MTESRPRRSKRFGRLVTIALSGVILLQLAYLGRGLLEDWICQKLASTLSEAVGADVEVAGLGGNWLGYLTVEDVNLTGGEEALLQAVDGLRAEVWFSPLGLITDGLRGLRACRITARRAEIRTDGVLPDAEPSNTEGSPAALRGLSGIFSEGASVEIQELSYGTPLTRRAGPLRIRVAPGEGRRVITVDHGDLHAQVSVHPVGADSLGFGVGMAANAPGQVLRSFGLANEFAGGQLTLSGHCLLDPLQLAGTLALSDVRYQDRVINSSRLSWLLDSGSLHVSKGSLQLAGVSLQTDGIVAPSPLASTGMPLAAVRGNVNVEVSDLTPYVELLPEIADWMPLEGAMQAWVDGGRLHIVEAWAASEETRLRIGPGDVELASDGAGSVDFDLVVAAPRTVDLPGVGELQTSGSVRGSLFGDLSDPQVSGRLELGPTTLRGYRFERLASDVTYAQRIARLSGLDALELEVDQSTAISHVAGSLDLDLTDPDGGVLDFSLQGQAGDGWLDLLDMPNLPEIATPSFTVTGTTELGDELPTGNAEVALRGLSLPPHLPADVSAQLTLSAEGVLDVDSLAVRGPASLDVTGSVPLDGGPMRLAVVAPEQELTFLTSFLPTGPLLGSFNLQLNAEGDPDQLVFDLELGADVLDAADRLAAIWPTDSLGPAPSGSSRIDLRLRQTLAGIEVDQLSLISEPAGVTGRGAMPIQLSASGGTVLDRSDQFLELVVSVAVPGPPELDLPVTFASNLRVGSSEVRLDDIELSAGPGRVSGTISAATGWQDWLGADPRVPALTGNLLLDELSLEVLPAEALGLGVLEGTLSGSANLAGTVDQPEPEIDLVLADSVIRAGTLPRLESLGAQISVHAGRIAVTGLSGKMGGGRLEGSLTVQAANRYLWEPGANPTITGELTGRDVLLLDEQNLRLRGHLGLDISGTPEEVLVGGSLDITNGRYARRLTLLPDLSIRGGEATAVSGGLRLVPIESALGQRVKIDLGIRTARDFQVRTNILDTDLVCDLRLRGQASLAFLEGTVSSAAGILRLPGSGLRLDSLLVTFPPENPLQPELVAQASGRRHGVQIQMDVHGPLASPEIQISSIPAFTPQELWTLVTAGALPETLRSRGLEGQAALVGSYLAEELAAWYIGGESMQDTTTFFDRFTFVSGEDIGDNGRENLLVEFALTDNVSLQGELDVFSHYNGGLVLRFRF